MANLWEQKIGSDVTHGAKLGRNAPKTSPTTVLNSTEADVAGRGIALTKAGSAQASGELTKRNTKEIVKSELH